ncbi:DinB family protein [Pedobacter caeni]|uniref:DinB superfamily protein n=1 Tax=Pedobacter caeni TaxID=288992 RepID=A0A1M5A503_9SPHI|nr:DinB family protein [Pedobacter caeni]SHF24942.1 DinB superfamily protein [Pedobacter caeni]
MKIKNEELITELLEITGKCSIAVRKMRMLDLSQLNYKRTAETWSILECIEHLNLYGDFYLPLVAQEVLSHQPGNVPGVFRTGIIGNYFVNLIRVKSGSVKKMSAQKEMNPLHGDLTITTIDRFLKQQEQLESLLIQCQAINLTKARTAISLTKWIKLRLGDTLRFLVYHIERHTLQAERIPKSRIEV